MASNGNFFDGITDTKPDQLHPAAMLISSSNRQPKLITNKILPSTALQKKTGQSLPIKSLEGKNKKIQKGVEAKGGKLLPKDNAQNNKLHGSNKKDRNDRLGKIEAEKKKSLKHIKKSNNGKAQKEGVSTESEDFDMADDILAKLKKEFLEKDNAREEVIHSNFDGNMDSNDISQSQIDPNPEGTLEMIRQRLLEQRGTVE